MALPRVGQESRPARVVTAAAALEALQGAATRLGDESSEYRRRVLALPWQRRALEYVDLIPELNYASRFYTRMMKQLIVFPGTLDAQGKITRIEQGPPVDILNRIRDPGGGRQQLLGDYGRLMFITGEGTLFGRDLDTPRERWNFLWNDELRITYGADGEVARIEQFPSWNMASPTIYEGDEAVAYRMWTSHPRRSGEAESPMRAALEIAEELIILSKSVRATAVSRITNGILLFPTEMTPGPAEAVGDEDLMNDPFFQDIAYVFQAQVENPAAPAARIPPVVDGGAEWLDKVRLLKLHDPATDYLEKDLRAECIERLARGFDFPPEVLVGLSTANHWAAKQILDDMWRSHGAPLAQTFCDQLSDVYLRPALRDAEYEGWEEVVISYDESKITVPPDRSDDADKAYDRGMVSDKGYRLMKSIPEDYAPSEEEKQLWLETKLRLPLAEVEPAGAEPAPNPSAGPPPPGPEGDSGRRTRVVASAGRELGVAEAALLRCRELAGSRLLSYRDTCPECFNGSAHHPKSLVASIVGPENLRKMKLEPLSLVKDGADALRTIYRQWGYEEEAVEQIAEMVEVYAARTLFEEAPSVPSALEGHIEHMKEV